jgi:ethanolamine utilization protein EutA
VQTRRRVSLIGLDFGTTTSSAVVASASIEQRWAAGRVELADFDEPYRSEIVFTPFRDDAIDEARVGELIEGWLAEAGVRAEALFGGGAILTGLAAERRNAARLTELIRARIGGAVLATADDPCLESWMAFMGSAAALSRARPDTPVLNLDIGGGTTNLALISRSSRAQPGSSGSPTMPARSSPISRSRAAKERRSRPPRSIACSISRWI